MYTGEGEEGGRGRGRHSLPQSQMVLFGSSSLSAQSGDLLMKQTSTSFPTALTKQVPKSAGSEPLPFQHGPERDFFVGRGLHLPWSAVASFI